MAKHIPWWGIGMIFLLLFIANAISVMAAIPSVRWLNQSPTDITTTNIVSDPLRIFYDIQDADGYLNLSTIFIYSKHNTATSDISYYLNGSYYTGYNWTDTYTLNVSEQFLFNLSDNDVYPGSYNFNWEYTKQATHTAGTLANSNNWLWVELYNVSSTAGENYFEIMVNNSAGTDYAKIYYCNSSYTTGSPTSSGYCVNLYNVPTNTYNHYHSPESAHQLAPFAISSGKVGSVDITDTSYFLINGRTGSTVQYWYITNSSRTNAMKTSANNGATWSPQTFTADSHIHQYDGTDIYTYYACASDDVNITCSSETTQSYISGDVPELPTDTTITESFSTGTCPTDSLQNTILYCFFGLVIILLFWYSDSKNFGLGLIITSILLIFYSLPLFGCQLIWGFAVLLFGVVIGIYAIKWKYY